MAIDLKPYFDAARAADDEVQRIMAKSSGLHRRYRGGKSQGARTEADPGRSQEARRRGERAVHFPAKRDGGERRRGEELRAGVCRHGRQPDGEEADPKAFEALDAYNRMKFIEAGGGVAVNKEPE